MLPTYLAGAADSGVTAGRAANGEGEWRPPNMPLAVAAERRALVVWAALLAVFSVCLLLGRVWVRIMVVEAGYHLSVRRQLVERLEKEGRELAVRAATADTSARLEELAARRLGMRRPLPEEEGLLP